MYNIRFCEWKTVLDGFSLTTNRPQIIPSPLEKLSTLFYFQHISEQKFLNLSLDLDQLNHILGILGSPSQEDLDCIINEKVSTIDLEYWKEKCRMQYSTLGWIGMKYYSTSRRRV